ncbi:MAG: succinyl-diaminopimelate desuccinylase [Proteobacteria bacterium]|nr:succinyl-diaminopimelate desuccinylase [Pseudomonadota bacterium]
MSATRRRADQRALPDPLALAQALVRCPSVTPRDAGALAVIERALGPLGFECHRLRFGEGGREPVENLYARLGRLAPNFCFAGHTDVVPPGPREAWSADPFAAEVRDGVLYGRGACDMKGAIACFVAAVARFLAARRGPAAGSISVLITGDEEGEALDGTARVLAWLKERGERLDACLVGEPTNPKRLGEMVKIGRRGSMSGWLTVQGRQGHTAYPARADNPVHRLIAMLAPFAAAPLDDGTADFEPSTLQVTTIDVGNPTVNVIPGEARAAFNIRFNDLHTAASIEERLRAAFDASGARYELRVMVSGEAFLTPPGPLSEVLVRAIERVTGSAPVLGTTGGTSDARFIRGVCPVAEFGLVGQSMHAADERVPLADLERLTEIYRAVLDEFFASRPKRAE